MENHFPGGVWPVMLTPFTKENEVDYQGLEALTEWYIREGCSGLFAVTQSSEMFFLSLEERIQITSFVKKIAAGRLPVIASGHVSASPPEQAEEIRRIAEAGADAVVLVTNRLAGQEESGKQWLMHLEELLKRIPDWIKLGLYECPYPYKKVMSEEMTEWCARSGRFYFLKDTSCDLESMKRKLRICEGTNLKLYNANTATLLESMRLGASGYSGVMANMQCRLYDKLTKDYAREDLTELSEILSMCAMIERQWYPSNAKYYLQQEGIPLLTKCRTQDERQLTATWKNEVKMLRHITKRLEQQFIREVKDEREGMEKQERKVLEKYQTE